MLSGMVNIFKETLHKALQATKDWQEREKKSSLGKSTHQLVIQDQTVSPENKHISDVIQTEKVVFLYLGIYMYIHKFI